MAMVFLLWWGGALCAESLPVSAEPFEIKDRIAADPGFDVGALWPELGISPQLQTPYGCPVVDSGSPVSFDHCERCTAEIIRSSFGSHGDGIILKVYEQWGFSRSLVFFPLQGVPLGSSQWQFIGHADHDFAQHFMPKHRIETVGTRTYLVLTVQGVTGTGLSLDYERWYEVDPADMAEVLTLPVRGHECSDASSLCRAFEVNMVPGSGTDRFLEVMFAVEYNGSRFLLDGSTFEDIPLFAARRRALFVRDGELHEYTLFQAGSEITMDEICSGFNVGTLGCDDFLRFNADELTRCVSGADRDVRDWLTAYLRTRDATSEQDAVRGASAW